VAKDIRVIPELVEARRLALAHNVLPITHSFVSDLETPVSAFLKLGAPRRAFLLESAEQGQHMGRFSFLGVGARALVTYQDGRLTVQEKGDRLSVEHDDPFTAVADLMRSYRPPTSGVAADLPPLAGGLVGYFGYDLVRRLEPLPDAPPDDLGLPEMAFLLADTVLVFDHLKHTITIVANAFVEGRDVDGPYERAVERIADVREKLAAPLPAGAAGRMVDAAQVAGGADAEGRAAAGGPAARYHHVVPRDGLASPTIRPVTSSMTQEQYEAGVERCREYIYAGDAFQIVLSQRFSTPVDVSPFSIYRGVRAVNPSPYLYYIAFDDFALCGSSPEPLVTVQGERVETRPIAGTRRRGASPTEDRLLMADLRADEKERAEHVMLVDLGRNDLGRVCVPGTVKVDEFMEMELYSHVIHMVSSVSGTLAEGNDPAAAIKAAFPAGTVSGAPKVRAMQIVDELETVRRGPYAGAIGYLSYGGDLDTCICIRTVIVKDGVAHVQAGAGIVADSVPAMEYAETRNKAAALLRAIDLAHEQFGDGGPS
jgi:anthranilate synthase component 1